jgi:hypothetical protein
LKKILVGIIALLAAFVLFAGVAPVTSPVNAAAAATSTSFGVKGTCTTNASGYCTLNHNLGVIPDVVQAQAVNYNALTTTRNWTANTVEVRLAKRINTSNGVDPWPNVTVQVTLLGTYTSGATPTPTTTAPTTPVPTTTVPPTTEPTTVPPTTPPTTETPPVIWDYPTATSTGVPAGTTLTNSGGMVITAANTVVDSKNVTGSIDIRAPGVVIKNSKISGIVVNDNISTHHAFTITDSQVGSDTGCSTFGNGAIGIENYTATRVKVVGYSDAFRVAGGDITIQDSWVKLCATDPNAHSDGIQAYGASGGQNIVIRHNVIDQRSVLEGTATSPIFIPNDGANQGNQGLQVTVDDNVVAGGGFSIRVFGDLPFTAPSVSGNKIVNNTWAYGPFDLNCSRIGDFEDNAVVTFDWTNGKVLSQVRPLNDCA